MINIFILMVKCISFTKALLLIIIFFLVLYSY